MPDMKFLSSLSVLLSTDNVAAEQVIKSGLPDSTSVHVFNRKLEGPLREAALRRSFDILVIVRTAINRDFLKAIEKGLMARPVPILLFVDDDKDGLARDAIRSGISSYVVAGLIENRVATLVEVAVERFKLNQALQLELIKSKENLAARKIVERAKGLLMERRGLSEQDAYRTLREMAMKQSKPIKDVSETLLAVSDLIQ